jgi:hypothetical protein
LMKKTRGQKSRVRVPLTVTHEKTLINTRDFGDIFLLIVYGRNC